MFASTDDVVYPAQRPTVLLLHSSASSSRQWEALIGALQPRFHVRAVDFHGHGGEAAWCGEVPLTLADEAARAALLLAEAGGAHVVGHSYGAAVALKLAALHPGLVRSVVAYEPVLFGLLIDDGASQRRAADIIAFADSIRDLLVRGQENSAAMRFVDFWSGPGSWQSLAGGRRNSVAARMRAVLRHFEALFRESLRPAQLARLGVPMLFMAGTRTVAVTRRLAELLRHALPQARHEWLQGMGHMGPVTHAAEVNRRIVQFLHVHARSSSTLEPASALA